MDWGWLSVGFDAVIEFMCNCCKTYRCNGGLSDDVKTLPSFEGKPVMETAVNPRAALMWHVGKIFITHDRR
jgi:hypothetical protein